MLYRHCLDTWHSLNYFHYIKILIIILLYTNIGLQLHHSAEELVHINYGFGIYNKNIFINWKVKFVLSVSVYRNSQMCRHLLPLFLFQHFTLNWERDFLKMCDFCFSFFFYPLFQYFRLIYYGNIFMSYIYWNHWFLCQLQCVEIAH